MRVRVLRLGEGVYAMIRLKCLFVRVGISIASSEKTFTEKYLMYCITFKICDTLLLLLLLVVVVVVVVDVVVVAVEDFLLMNEKSIFKLIRKWS